MARYNVGLVGAGTVGGGVIEIFHAQKKFFAGGLGLDIALKRVVDKNVSMFESLPLGDTVCSERAEDIISDPDIQIVIELVGGTTFARDLLLRACAAGKHVITANKALIAEYGPEIFETAEKHDVSVAFEASVGGGMPAIKTIREAMIGNDIKSLKTIINGTCNYILTRMQRDGLPFETALALAQENGFAEADPTLDIGGGDTRHKVAIMASLLFGGYVSSDSIPMEGITLITAQDIAYAHDLGYRIKLLGIIREPDGLGRLDVRVHPAMLHSNHILASVDREYNAVLLEGNAVGEILLYGKGAGRMPTASAVISDVVDTVRNIEGKCPRRIPMNYYSRRNEIAIKPLDEVQTRFYMRFTVEDKPRVLALIAAHLGDHGISIASVMQREQVSDDAVPVVILTHHAREKDLRDAVAAIEPMDFVRDTTQVIRIEE